MSEFSSIPFFNQFHLFRYDLNHFLVVSSNGLFRFIVPIEQVLQDNPFVQIDQVLPIEQVPALVA